MTSSARASSAGGTVKAECLRGLEVDDELKLCGLLDREITWLPVEACQHSWLHA